MATAEFSKFAGILSAALSTASSFRIWNSSTRILSLPGASVLGTGLPGLGTEHLPGALCSGTGSPALGLCSPRQGSQVPMRWLGGARHCSRFQAPPGSQASSRGEAKDSALLSSRDAGLLEPPERLSISDSDRKVPACWYRRVRPRLFWRMGLLLPLELLRGSQAPRRAVCGTRGSLRTMHGS